MVIRNHEQLPNKALQNKDKRRTLTLLLSYQDKQS